MLTRFIGKQVLKRASKGNVVRVNRVQALIRLPTLLKLCSALLRDSRIPIWQRAGVVGLVGLILSPIDALGNIPVVGQFWDLSLAVVVLDTFVATAPAAVVNEHIIALGLQKKFPLRDT